MNAVLDQSVALSRVGGDEELLREIAALFLSEYPEMLQKLAAGIRENNAQAVERAAHSIKGSVANFGAPEAYHAAAELEKAGRAGDLRDALRHLSDLDRVLAVLHSELAAL